MEKSLPTSIFKNLTEQLGLRGHQEHYNAYREDLQSWPIDYGTLHFFHPYFSSNKKSSIIYFVKIHLELSLPHPPYTMLKSIKCTRYSRHFGLLTLNIVQGGRRSRCKSCFDEKGGRCPIPFGQGCPR